MSSLLETESSSTIPNAISMISRGPIRDAIRILHYTFPAMLLAYYVIAQSICICTLQGLRGRRRGRQVPRKPTIVLQVAVLILYAVEASLLILDAWLNATPNAHTDSNNAYFTYFYQVSALLEVFTWTVLTATFIESGTDIVWYPLYGSWIISIMIESVFFGLEFLALIPFKHEAPKSLDYAQISFKVLRLGCLILLLLLYFHQDTERQCEKDEESASLLRSADLSSVTLASNGGATYGSIFSSPTADLDDSDDDAVLAKMDYMKGQHMRRLRQSGTWLTYLKGFSVFVPLLWASGQPRVQMNLLGVVVCLIVGRILNLLVPRQMGILIDSLADILLNHANFPAIQLGLLLMYRFLSSNSTIGELNSILWLPFGQHAAKSIKTTAHRKVIGLSRDFQTQKTSGEIIGSIDQGMTVIWLFRNILMYMLPCMLDMLIAGVYLSYVFGSYMALLLGSTAILYLWVSVHLDAKRVQPQRDALKMARRETQVLYESIGEWDSLSYFGGQAYENDRMSKTISIRHLANRRLRWLVMQSDVAAEVVIQLGFAVACSLVVSQILQGTQKIGSFPMMIFYFLNVTSSLECLTSMGSSFLHDLVEAEKLRDLLLTQPSVQDGPSPFRFCKGAVLFNGVSFSYDDKTTNIQDFNFSAEAGHRIALVGETGAGKRTILRLLFRFYDVQTGKIMIDGQDIRDVKLDSLRNCMGVVPQDPLLFDNSILENVRYSRPEASDQEVVDACKAAAIHEKILTHANGYDTKVGEHGIKLSGGEKQCIAIARVMLKNSKIILLDEATSSVDSGTEYLVQTALTRLTSGRTTFTIAHRLSTVKNSDVVLIMKHGRIVEQGCPGDLLEGGGQFAQLWKSQFGIEAAADSTDDKHKAAGETTFAGENVATDFQDSPRSKRHVLERSASSFRPDAPEFVPHYQRSTEASSGQPSHTHLGIGHSHSHKDTSNFSRSAVQTVRRLDRGLPQVESKEPKPVDKPSDEPEGISEAATVEFRPSTVNTKYDGPASETAHDDKPTPRLNRWQRRRQARSEPHRSAMGSSQADGTSEDRKVDELELKTASRRVSGPGYYPSGTKLNKSSDQDSKSLKATNQNLRRKRQRHVRMKRSEQSGSGCAAVSSATSSSGGFSDSRAIPMPKTPASTPNNEANSSTNPLGPTSALKNGDYLKTNPITSSPTPSNRRSRSTNQSAGPSISVVHFAPEV